MGKSISAFVIVLQRIGRWPVSRIQIPVGNLSGTNVDWGHNVFYLRDELKRRGWDSVGASLWTRYDLKLTGIQAEITKIPKWNSESLLEKPEDRGKVLLPGRYAVSVCIVQGTMGVPSGTKKGEPIDNGYTYFQEFKPVGHIGYSIWLYDLSEEDLLASKSWGELYRQHIELQQNKIRRKTNDIIEERGKRYCWQEMSIIYLSAFDLSANGLNPRWFDIELSIG